MAACLSSLAAPPAFAGDLDLTLPAAQVPIGFATPDRGDSATLPAGVYDRNGLDARGGRSGFAVSGSVTTGIGYSTAYGNSNSSSAHLRVAHAGDDDGGDASPSRVTLDIAVGTSRGPGFIGPDGYRYRDRGGHDFDDDRFDAFRVDESRMGESDVGDRGRR